MGGGGLIGWTPLQSGMVTGDSSADLQTQLKDLLTYNQIWSGYIPALNSASSPASAAFVIVTAAGAGRRPSRLDPPAGRP